MSTLIDANTGIALVVIVVALVVLTGVLYRRRSDRGANSAKVRYRTAGADQTESLAVVAEREYYARKTPAYRALALRQIRKWAAIAGGFLMLGLGAWSAVGVQHAVAAGAARGSIEWLLGWVLEPVLLTGVALIVIVRSALALAGAHLSGWVWGIELGLLGLSVAANVQALPVAPSGADYVMRLTGPVGCLLVSLVLVLVEKAVQAADIAVSAETTGRFDGVRTRLADTATKIAERAADTLADRLSGDDSDSERTPADTAAGQVPDTTADSAARVQRTAADSGDGQAASVDLSSADTEADSKSDTAGHPAGQVPDAAADGTADSGADTASAGSSDTSDEAPGQGGRTVFERALDAARELDADTIETLSVRALAERIGCGKTTAGQVRSHLLAEQSAADERVEA
ncbi:hypothetical protein [Saccharopolyspora sp. 6V]|uniref:hypothetical protein n=1 Tax=Saccharopolyspora sp. 6V TaxID=2877239 RepID=UPI001CD60DDD|nr:hypothetical protein [Saccharopolyspora sp. 6V]MCA1191646.1 hypothetical protein [Saccharopolyspora sp. 6V]